MMINLGCAGCLLPFLVLFNLLFGWLIFRSFLMWLAVESGLVALLLLTSYISIRRYKKDRDGVIDIEGEIVEEKGKLK